MIKFFGVLDDGLEAVLWCISFRAEQRPACRLAEHFCGWEMWTYSSGPEARALTESLLVDCQD